MAELEDDQPVVEPAPAGNAHDDDLWWVRSLGGPVAPAVDPVLPTAVRLRREVDALPSTLAELGTEPEVRGAVAALNARIAAWSSEVPTEDTSAPDAAPAEQLGPVDVDGAVARWEAARTRQDEPDVPAPSRRRPWRRRGTPVVDEQ